MDKLSTLSDRASEIARLNVRIAREPGVAMQWCRQRRSAQLDEQVTIGVRIQQPLTSAPLCISVAHHTICSRTQKFAHMLSKFKDLYKYLNTVSWSDASRASVGGNLLADESLRLSPVDDTAKGLGMSCRLCRLTAAL